VQLQSYDGNADQAILARYERLIQQQQPAHPDSYATYIEAVRTILPRNKTHPYSIITKLQWIRALFENGLAAAVNNEAINKNTGYIPPTPTVPSNTDSRSLFCRNYGLAVREFCLEYLEFEHLFGSDNSYESARQAVQRVSWNILKSQRNSRGAKTNQHESPGSNEGTEISKKHPRYDEDAL
jgi:hypothetical protein